jgi:hypothetical protein
MQGDATADLEHLRIEFRAWLLLPLRIAVLVVGEIRALGSQPDGTDQAGAQNSGARLRRRFQDGGSSRSGAGVTAGA